MSAYDAPAWNASTCRGPMNKNAVNFREPATDQLQIADVLHRATVSPGEVENKQSPSTTLADDTQRMSVSVDTMKVIVVDGFHCLNLSRRSPRARASTASKRKDSCDPLWSLTPYAAST